MRAIARTLFFAILAAIGAGSLAFGFWILFLARSPAPLLFGGLTLILLGLAWQQHRYWRDGQ